MTRSQYERGLWSWTDSIMDPLSITPTIYSNGGAPRPIPPYATVLVLADVQIYQPERFSAFEEGVFNTTIKLTRQGTAAITIYGEGHNNAGHALVASAWKQSTLDLLAGYGLAVYGGNVQILSTDSDGVTETRSVVDINFRWAFVDSDVHTNWIETAIITGTING